MNTSSAVTYLIVSITLEYNVFSINISKTKSEKFPST